MRASNPGRIGAPGPIAVENPKLLGCAPCKAMEKQKEANEEFARRFGVVKDVRRRGR